MSHLASTGYQVTVERAPDTVSGDASGMDLIVVSSTVSSGDVGTKFVDAAVPVIFWEQGLLDEFGLAGTSGNGTTANATAITIEDSAHPLAAALSGTVTVSTSGQPLSFANPTSGDAFAVANSGDPAQKVIVGIDKNGVLESGGNAAERRVFLFMGDNTAADFTSQGWALFDAAVQWATGMGGTPTGPRLSISLSGGMITITWSGGGTLQEADSVTGPWTDVTGASSPYTTAADAPHKFYRVH